MTKNREPDPEGDKADEAPYRSLEACPTCRGPLDTNGDCVDSNCTESPLYFDDQDEDDEEDLDTEIEDV